MRVTKSNISLDLECWVDELSPAQMAAYEKVANEHNAIKNALKTALNANEGKELFNGEVFQAYSFKGKVLQQIKEATVPKKPAKPEMSPAPPATGGRNARKRPSNFVYLESSDEDDDDIPLAKRITTKKGAVGAKSEPTLPVAGSSKATGKKGAAAASAAGKSSPTSAKNSKAAAAKGTPAKSDKSPASTPTAATNFRPSEVTSIGGLVVDTETAKDKTDSKENNKDTKLQGKTFPSLVVVAKPSLKVKDMSTTRNKLDSKVKLVLMLTPNKFTEWLIQEGLLKSQQFCSNHRSNDLKLGVFSDATKFPYTGGYVWISECCPLRFVSVFHGSIFEGAPHPPSCILKLIYHWSCQTIIQNVVQWVKVDNVYIKGVYTWLRAICTLAVHQKCKKLGGADKFVEVGVISLGTTSQDGQQRQVKVEVLGVLDHAEKTIRLRAVEPITDLDRNYKKRFQTILEPLQRWVHKDSIITIDLTVDRNTLTGMGFTNVVQAAASDTTAKHNNSTVMDYLRRIVPRMFQNTLSLLSRQMIQQFLDELVWREQFGTYALQAFNNITSHIAEQTRMTTNETLTQRLYQVATNPFKDWSQLPANYKDTPANNTPKRLKKPIDESDYYKTDSKSAAKVKKEKEEQKSKEKEKSSASTAAATSSKSITNTVGTTKKRAAAIAAAANLDDDYPKETKKSLKKLDNPPSVIKPSSSKSSAHTSKSASSSTNSKHTSSNTKNRIMSSELKPIKKEDTEPKAVEELYYGVIDGYECNFEPFPYAKNIEHNDELLEAPQITAATTLECPICDIKEQFDSNEKLQTHLVSHITPNADKTCQFQCLFCLDKFPTEDVLAKHNSVMHTTETKPSSSVSYHCIICPIRFNSLMYLAGHMQKMHNVLELPYACQACGYRSSSHRDLVRHFYDDHKQQNFLQCPFCLDIFRFCYKGKLDISHIENFYLHLQHHTARNKQVARCPKCALNFISKGNLKQHMTNHHVTMQKHSANIRKLMENSFKITPPKVRSHHREQLPYTFTKKLGDFFALIDGHICAECNSEIINEDHYPGVLKCQKCKYTTCCERVMFQHAIECASNTRDTMELPLPNEMHCVCGFSTAIGNKMATHLVQCGQRSSYPTLHAAQENTVKRNMLDMLGLVRRDGEQGGEMDNATSNTANTSGELNTTTEEEQSQQQDNEEYNSDAAAAAYKMQTSNDASAAAPDVGAQAQATNANMQFDVMQAAPMMDSGSLSTDYSALEQAQQQQEQQTVAASAASTYQLSFDQSDMQQHTLAPADIDMPLIGELSDPNTPGAAQFLADVHTPMFDAVAAAEQQHYNQLMQQQQHHHQQLPHEQHQLHQQHQHHQQQ